MAVKRGGLGKGLDSLIPSSSAKIKKAEKANDDLNLATDYDENKIMMKLSLIEPNREQPRKAFDEDALLELSESIKQFGVLQPLLVQKKDGYYQIIAGERRWRASKMAGLKEVPVVVRDFSEQEILEISLIENIQRENLNPIEEAWAYRRLLDEFHLKQDEIAERVSKSRTAVTNAMRLLKLDEQVQQMVIDEMISTGHARALLGLEDKEIQKSAALRIFDEKMSVRETEKMVRELTKPKKEKNKEVDKTREIVYHSIEEKIKGIMGTKVQINDRGNKGRIEIEYYSEQDLERIIEMLETIES